VTATTITIKIRRFATKSCSRIALAWRLAPAEMDHPDGDNGDHSETRHWTKTAIERTATTSTATMITTPMTNRDGATDSPSTASSGGPGDQPGAARAELSEGARRG
jgi:hypothetical protein